MLVVSNLVNAGLNQCMMERSFPNMYCDLYINDYAPSQHSRFDSFELCENEISIESENWQFEFDDYGLVARYPEVQFDVDQRIFGYAILRQSDNTLLWAEKFPRSFYHEDGFRVLLTPTIRLHGYFGSDLDELHESIDWSKVGF